MAFAEFMVYGTNAAGTMFSRFPLLDPQWINTVFNSPSLPLGTFPIINGRDWVVPVKRVLEQLGSISNPHGEQLSFATVT